MIVIYALIVINVDGVHLLINVSLEILEMQFALEIAFLIGFLKEKIVLEK
jgi:hypothetical protein